MFLLKRMTTLPVASVMVQDVFMLLRTTSRNTVWSFTTLGNNMLLVTSISILGTAVVSSTLPVLAKTMFPKKMVATFTWRAAGVPVGGIPTKGETTLHVL